MGKFGGRMFEIEILEGFEWLLMINFRVCRLDRLFMIDIRILRIMKSSVGENDSV